jgi:hypothetical protein
LRATDRHFASRIATTPTGHLPELSPEDVASIHGRIDTDLPEKYARTIEPPPPVPGESFVTGELPQDRLRTEKQNKKAPLARIEPRTTALMSWNLESVENPVIY